MLCTQSLHRCVVPSRLHVSRKFHLRSADCEVSVPAEVHGATDTPPRDDDAKKKLSAPS